MKNCGRTNGRSERGTIGSLKMIYTRFQAAYWLFYTINIRQPETFAKPKIK